METRKGATDGYLQQVCGGLEFEFTCIVFFESTKNTDPCPNHKKMETGK